MPRRDFPVRDVRGAAIALIDVHTVAVRVAGAIHEGGCAHYSQALESALNAVGKSPPNAVGVLVLPHYGNVAIVVGYIWFFGHFVYYYILWPVLTLLVNTDTSGRLEL